MIDLRSDTVTRPCEGMLDQMIKAKVGDDVLGDDPTVMELESKVSDLFDVESALFCPSGTMTNQIALNLLCPPRSEVLLEEYSHVYRYEGGGLAFNSGITVKCLKGEKGILNPEIIEESINPDDCHFPKTACLSIENTSNKGGGTCYEIDQLEKFHSIAKKNDLKMHLDGARIWNSAVAKDVKLRDYSKYFDTISVCLSKGLGAPVGSLLLGKSDFIYEARRLRKAFGGGMRQAGFLAAAGIFAIENNIERLKEDHNRARNIFEVLKGRKYSKNVIEPQTNIVIVELENGICEKQFLKVLESKGVFAVPFGKGLVRFVTHKDFSEKQFIKLEEVLKGTEGEFPL